jgi:hypothetical protein
VSYVIYLIELNKVHDNTNCLKPNDDNYSITFYIGCMNTDTVDTEIPYPYPASVSISVVNCQLSLVIVNVNVTVNCQVQHTSVHEHGYWLGMNIECSPNPL